MTAFNTTLKSSNQIIQKFIRLYCIVAWTLLHLHEMPSGSTYISDFAKTLILKLNKLLNIQGYEVFTEELTTPRSPLLQIETNRILNRHGLTWVSGFIFFVWEAEHNYYFAEAKNISILDISNSDWHNSAICCDFTGLKVIFITSPYSSFRF